MKSGSANPDNAATALTRSITERWAVSAWNQKASQISAAPALPTRYAYLTCQLVSSSRPSPLRRLLCMSRRLANGMYQRAAPNIEPFAHRVQGAALVLAFAAVRQHEPRPTHHAARQRIPAIEVDSAIEEHLGRDGVGDEAGVVHGERQE